MVLVDRQGDVGFGLGFRFIYGFFRAFSILLDIIEGREGLWGDEGEYYVIDFIFLVFVRIKVFWGVIYYQTFAFYVLDYILFLIVIFCFF